MGKFEITKNSKGHYHFNLKAGNGKVILSSETYTTLTACKKGIESVRKHSSNMKMFEMAGSRDGKYYFNLKASNGKVIGTSETYENESNRKNGVQSVQKYAPAAAVVMMEAMVTA